jgi:hypothetical protein
LTGENRRTRIKTCPSATLSTTNPTWIDHGANPGLRGERPAANYLSYGTATTNIRSIQCSTFSYSASFCISLEQGWNDHPKKRSSQARNAETCTLNTSIIKQTPFTLYIGNDFRCSVCIPVTSVRNYIQSSKFAIVAPRFADVPTHFLTVYCVQADIR